MGKRKLRGVSGWGLLGFSKAGKIAVMLTLALFSIEPAVWAKTKTEVMECTMVKGKIVDKTGRPIGDCVLMKDGQMMLMTKGKMTPVKKDITLADGTVCKADGTLVLKGGKQIKFSNGEGFEIAGEKLFRVKGLSPPGSHFPIIGRRHLVRKSCCWALLPRNRGAALWPHDNNRFALKLNAGKLLLWNG